MQQGGLQWLDSWVWDDLYGSRLPLLLIWVDPPPRRSVGREGGLATFNPPPQVVGREGLVSQASSSTLSPPLPPPVAGQEGRVVCPPPPRNSGGREGDSSGSEEVLYDLEQ